MKRSIAALLVIPFLSSCAFLQNLNDPEIVSGVTVVTLSAVRSITPDTRRTQVANYADVYAAALRTVTGNPTSGQLMALLLSSIPASVKTQYPELVTLVAPLIVSNFQLLEAKYGSSKAVQIANDVATGVEAGVAQYVH